jgi:CDP-paratose 2-epimerase
MRILISGVCGFAGSTIARQLVERGGHEVIGFDNFSRAGSEINREQLAGLGVKVFYADLRAAADLDSMPACDWVLDAAAKPSVLAGVDGQTSSRQLVEYNLEGTINLLEYCKRHKAGFILLSTSRVYSIAALARIPLKAQDGAFRPAPGAQMTGLGPDGVTEEFSTTAPVSLYGATKLASEALALEYGEAFGLPVFINRCGVLAGAGQFGRADQGIFTYWINSHLRRRPLRYIGFGGHGHQVRDCLHPKDLLPLIDAQLRAPSLPVEDRVVNLSGGMASATSLIQMTEWCDARFGAHPVAPDVTPRPFDVPWIVLDHARASRIWNWMPQTSTKTIFEEIAEHAQRNPNWLDLSARF